MIPFLALALWESAPAEDPADPLAPALRGQLQCYEPDVAHRTCQSLAGYAPDAHGGYRNTARVLLSKAPRITFEIVTPVVVKEGAVCGSIRKADIDAGIVRRDESTLTGTMAQSIRDAVSGVLAAVTDHEICTRYVADGDHWIARGTLDGAANGLPEQTVIWVSPEDGYRVAR